MRGGAARQGKGGEERASVGKKDENWTRNGNIIAIYFIYCDSFVLLISSTGYREQEQVLQNYRTMETIWRVELLSGKNCWIDFENKPGEVPE